MMKTLCPDENCLLSPEEGKKLEIDRELIWAWNQIVLRKRYSGTPAGFCTEEEKNEAVKQWKKQREDYRKTHEYMLRPTRLSGDDHFVGRAEEIEHICRIFSEGNGREKVLIHGMGGIGKTALARQIVRKMEGKYHCVLWLSYHTDILHTVCDDEQLQITNVVWHAGRYKNQTEYFREKWKIFCSLLKKKNTLLILDDVNHSKDRLFAKLWEIPCDVLITGRNCQPDWKVSSIPLGPLSKDWEWHEFYDCYGRDMITEEQCRKLNAYQKMIQGNTLLMRLAVCNPDLCEMIPDGLEQYFLRTNFLNAADIQILRYLSLMPVDGIEKRHFIPASGGKETAIQKLERMSLVWIEERNGVEYCGLHPVIAESVRCYYKPTQENCSSFLNGIAAQYEQLWNAPYEEVPKAVPICFALLRAWSIQMAWLFDAYDVLTNAIFMGGYFQEAQDYKKKLYWACAEYYGVDHQITGQAAMRVGAMYHNSLQFADAKEWYQKAFTVLKDSKPYNIFHELVRMQAAQTLCRNDRHEGKYESAMWYLEYSLQAHQRYMQQNPKAPAHHRQEIYFLLLEKAKLLAACGAYGEAERLCEEIEQGYRSENSGWVHFFEEVYLLQAEIQLKLGNAEAAVHKAEESTAIAENMRGENAKETLGCWEILADAYAAAGRREEADRLYQKVLEKLSFYYPLQKEWHESVYRKERANH